MSPIPHKSRTLTVALAGNPNCGKTAVFNGLTGLTAKVGNWPGVTVERREGVMTAGGQTVKVVDLPGIYSLSAESEDERAARDFLLSGTVDAVVCVTDASSLERSLYLTQTIRESGLPMAVALNMMDRADREGLLINTDKLEKELGCPVLSLTAVKPESLRSFRTSLADLLAAENLPQALSRGEGKISYPEEAEPLLSGWSEKALREPARQMGVAPRFLAAGLLEEDPYLIQLLEGRISEKERTEAVKAVEGKAGMPVDMVLAEGRFTWITGVCRRTVKTAPGAGSPSEAGGDKAGTAAGGVSRGRGLDRILLNRFLGIPIFLGVMYLVFALTLSVGGAFIDFFDILFGGILVDGLGALMAAGGLPQGLITLAADGIGGGIQTVATFVPIIFMMFLMLALLEDSGYMARAAFVMDRAMRAIGLPGKAFVPMLVGFGCTVPAIMATRTLESRRDRFMAIFMTPFMSCGARLPVYALFTAAFFGARSGAVVFSLYMVGILFAILTGLLLKLTLFKGTHSPFVMELPAYHLPRAGAVLKNAGRRLKIFILRAGKVIVLVVLLLAFLNSWGMDGSFGNQDSRESVLSAVGKAITPIFTPMGIEKDNWPATVSLFTGLFAKEVIVGTINSLYLQEDGAAEEGTADGEGEAASSAAEPWRLGPILAESFGSIGANLAGLAGSLTDPLGMGLISGDAEAAGEELETGGRIFQGLRSRFTPVSAYAFLLFVLLYFPCVAALGAAVQETGPKYGALLVTYLTLLGWIVATLFYQLFEGGSALWIAVALLMLAGIIGTFAWLGRGRERIEYPS